MTVRVSRRARRFLRRIQKSRTIPDLQIIANEIQNEVDARNITYEEASEAALRPEREKAGLLLQRPLEDGLQTSNEARKGMARAQPRTTAAIDRHNRDRIILTAEQVRLTLK